MSHKNRRYAGFWLTEIVVAVAVMGVIMMSLGLSLRGFAKFNRYQLVRQHCIAAAQAQLDSITATNGPIPEERFQSLWPDISVSIETSPGAGRWEAMTFVEVTAAGKSFRKEVKVRLSRYVRGDRAVTAGAEQDQSAKEE
ncbi:MAG: type II secretion system protein [Planctomycetes bacterium]|nr:type II secretion system protein [Planctomycetota bacterium]